jgi:spermidine/putrescine transport system permease protein
MMNSRWGRYILPLFVAQLYMFLYVPLFVLIIFSFNDNRLGFDWVGFTTKWYSLVWKNTEIWHALYNSLIVASSSVLLCLSMSALFIFYGSRSFVKKTLILFYGNLAIPEIVLAVGLMSLFYFISVPLSLSTLIAAHTVLGLGYVVPIVHDRYAELDQRYMEASMDLGATTWQTFRRVVLPLLFPALLTSGLLVFIISFDDFVLSFFCSGGATVTLPMYIFAKIRSGGSPLVSALSTMLLMLSSVVVLLFLSLQARRSEEVE